MLGVSDASTSPRDDSTDSTDTTETTDTDTTDTTGPKPGTDARLAEIVRSWPEAIVGETVDGVVTAWNRAAEGLYGYREEEILGQRADRLYPSGRQADEADRLRRLAHARPNGQRPDPCTVERTRRDGSAVTVSLRVHPITDDTGTTIGFVSLTTAVASPEGLAAEKTGARLLHDLRTPLQAIIGFTGTLLMRLPGPLNAEQEHQLQLVQASAQQLLTLINQLPYPDAR